MIDPGHASLKRTLIWLALFLTAFYFAVEVDSRNIGNIDIVGLAFALVFLVSGSIEAGRVIEAADNPPPPRSPP